MMNERTVRLLVPITLLALLAPPGPVGPPPGAALALSPRAPADTLVVTTTDDETGECTVEYCALRQALEAANANAGSDTITFDIPTDDPGYDPGAGQWTIALSAGPLPALADAGTVLDATQGGDCSARVVIDATGVSYGLEITGTNHTVSGLVLRNANTYGLYIHGATAQSNTLSCSYVISNTVDGVRIADSASGNAIGSTSDDLPNVIALNGDDGIEITNGANNNTVVNNYIGTDLAGMTVYPNSGYGVRLSGGAITNTVGLVQQGGNNLISGNTLGGVLISGSTTRGNVVQNNRIGTDSGGAAAIAGLDAGLVYHDGVVISGAAYNTIGPDNLISGHRRDGVRIEGGAAEYNVVKGNYIGANADGDQKVTNRRFGMWLADEAHHNTIGTTTHGNLISGNGYDGDFAVAGGVAILDGSGHNTLHNNTIGMTSHGGALPNGGPGVRLSLGAAHNTFGYSTSSTHANTIAWNEGDGIYIEGSGSYYNTIHRNAIHDNDDLGIDNESGGNRELFPPEILQYRSVSFGSGARTVSLRARTCITCTVMVYSDDGGEGRTFEGMVSSINPTNGEFGWTGNLSLGSAFTLVATDADGNSSEFSAAPVKLTLSIDDALPHVVVNKVPGDSDAPAGNTTVDFVAAIVGYDPTLRKDLNLELRLSSTVLGNPTRVFTRAQPSDYDGTPISWSNPSAGVYRVPGIDLSPDTNSAGQWTQRVVFRFNVPHAASPTPLAAFGFLTATGRTLNQGFDYAAMRLLQRADEIIITNRAQLYAQYDDGQTTTFLQNLYAFAQGPPFNWSPPSVIYYVDAYTSTLASWDNTTVSYASEGAANVAAELVDDLIEDWVEDSTTTYQKVCLPWFGCHQFPKDNPWYLLIAGDDNIVPFFRKEDPTDSEAGHPCVSGSGVLCALRNNDYFFTDNYYGDLSYVFDLFPWNEGGVELAVGRLVGTRAAHMSTLLHNGQYGPDTTRPARAIVNSGCGNDAQGVVNHLKNYGYDVLNDTESPSTVDNDNWQESTLQTLMQSNYQIFHHGNHANEGEWTTPPCGDSMSGIDTNDVWATNVSSRIAADYPIFTSAGCRAGLSAAEANTNPLSFTTNEPTMVNALVREGAAAVMASTGISFFDSDYGDVGGGEDFVKDFWGLAASPPPKQLNMGMALRWNKRTWDGHWSVDDQEEKTGAEFALYGVPWVTAPYRGGAASPHLQASASGELSPPEALGGQTYVVTATFDASNYSVNQVDGFDLVEVEGMELARDTGVPLAPLAEAELQLPPDGELVGVEAIAADPVDLGALDIPQELPGVPIPGGDPGGLAEAPDIGVYPPQPAVSRTVSLAGYNLARVYGSPLSYNTTTGQATLYQSLALRITYHLSSTVGLLHLIADPSDLAPEEPFSATATLINPSAAPVALTGTLTLKDSLGELVAVQALNTTAPGGGEQYSLELSWTAPITEGAYSLFMELYHAGSQQVIGHQTLSVSGGRITALSVPESAPSGQEVSFEITFANRRGETFDGNVALSIYDAQGAFVTTLSAPLSVGAQNEATAELAWDTEGMPVGTYVAAAEVTDVAESVTYGVIQEGFDLQNAVFLPLVLKS